MAFHSGFVAVIGRPNVGKSTLVNRLVGQKVAIVSDKPQTTRTRIRGVVTREDGQIILVDTPGIHRPRHRLGRYMIREAHEAMTDVDLIWFVRDATRPTHPEDVPIATQLAQVATPVFIVWNKIDLLEKGQAAALSGLEGLDGVSIPSLVEVFAVSATEGTGLDALVEATLARLPEGPQYYPADWVTDNPEQLVAAEIVREKVLHLTREEVPHSVAVVVEDFREREDRPLIEIRATLYVERESQKGIVIGKGGRLLKAVGEQARAELEQLLGKQVHLALWVKVKPDWREKEGALQEFGYR